MAIDPLPSPLPSRGMSQDAYNAAWEALLGALPAWGEQINDLGEDLNNLVNAAFTTSSATSLAIGTGAKTLTVEPNLGYTAGQTIVAAYMTDPTKQMLGVVTSYDSTTGALGFTSTATAGSGTYAAWSIGLVPASLSSALTGLTDAYSDRYRATVNALAALALDCTKQAYTKSISSNSTFTVSNVPAGQFILTVKLTLSSGAVPTWFAGVTWASGVTPTWANGTWVCMFMTLDGGSSWQAVAKKF